MKKHIILVLALVLSSGPLFAQSSHMTDDQVMSFVVKEHERGTANSQIVTKLMQKGVDISQIRRVRNKYQKMSRPNTLLRLMLSSACSCFTMVAVSGTRPFISLLKLA